MKSGDRGVHGNVESALMRHRTVLANDSESSKYCPIQVSQGWFKSTLFSLNILYQKFLGSCLPPFHLKRSRRSASARSCTCLFYFFKGLFTFVYELAIPTIMHTYELKNIRFGRKLVLYFDLIPLFLCFQIFMRIAM